MVVAETQRAPQVAGEDVVRPHKILVVEDNLDNREVYETILRHFGYDVITACDGAEGVQRALDSGPDLILMDIQMPVMDGLTASRILKGSLATSAIPIVILTAHIRPEDVATAREIGCSGFLIKPCPPKQVAEEAGRLLRARPAISC